MRGALAPHLLCALLAFGGSGGSGGCGAPPGRGEEAAPGPKVPESPSVVLPSGAKVRLEVARTDEERAQGLMFRASMPRDAGMVFLFETEEERPFWMKNCHFPIDIVHLRSDGTVVDVLENVPPCPADPCPSYSPRARGDTVVELNAGVSRENGVRPGARLRFVWVPGR